MPMFCQALLCGNSQIPFVESGLREIRGVALAWQHPVIGETLLWWYTQRRTSLSLWLPWNWMLIWPDSAAFGPSGKQRLAPLGRIPTVQMYLSPQMRETENLRIRCDGTTCLKGKWGVNLMDWTKDVFDDCHHNERNKRWGPQNLSVRCGYLFLKIWPKRLGNGHPWGP